MQYESNEQAMAQIDLHGKYFQFHEFMCPCCGIGLMDDECVASIEELRNHCGFPIVISSGYRCPKHNKEVGGAPESKHLLGQAVDINIGGLNSSQIHMLIELGMPLFNGFGFGKGKLHFDVREKPTAWGY